MLIGSSGAIFEGIANKGGTRLIVGVTGARAGGRLPPAPPTGTSSGSQDLADPGGVGEAAQRPEAKKTAGWLAGKSCWLAPPPLPSIKPSQNPPKVEGGERGSQSTPKKCCRPDPRQLTRTPPTPFVSLPEGGGCVCLKEGSVWLSDGAEECGGKLGQLRPLRPGRSQTPAAIGGVRRCVKVHGNPYFSNQKNDAIKFLMFGPPLPSNMLRGVYDNFL